MQEENTVLLLPKQPGYEIGLTKYSIYEDSFKIFENSDLEKTEVNNIDITYQIKNGILNTNQQNDIGIISGLSINKTFFENGLKVELDAEPKKTLLQYGLIMLMNRFDDTGLSLVYPKTFIILHDDDEKKSELKDEQKNHIKDVERIISIKKIKFDKGKVIRLCIIDMKPNKIEVDSQSKKIKLSVSATYFWLYSNSNSKDLNGLFDKNAHREEIKEIMKHFNEASQLYSINLQKYVDLKLGGLLYNDDSTPYSKISTYLNSKYLKPVETLDFAALFLVEHFMRNKISPQEIETEKEKKESMNLMKYFVLNHEKIINVFKTSMYLQEFLPGEPLDRSQLNRWVPSGHLDKHKYSKIYNFIRSQKK